MVALNVTYELISPLNEHFFQSAVSFLWPRFRPNGTFLSESVPLTRQIPHPVLSCWTLHALQLNMLTKIFKPACLFLPHLTPRIILHHLSLQILYLVLSLCQIRSVLRSHVIQSVQIRSVLRFHVIQSVQIRSVRRCQHYFSLRVQIWSVIPSHQFQSRLHQLMKNNLLCNLKF